MCRLMLTIQRYLSEILAAAGTAQHVLSYGLKGRVHEVRTVMRHTTRQLGMAFSLLTIIAGAAAGQIARQGIPVFPDSVPSVPGRVVALAAPPNGDPRMYALTINGDIIVVSDGAALPTPALSLGGTSSESAGYGIAFDPDYAVTGHVYVSFPTGSSHEVLRFSVSPSDPNVFDPASRTRVLLVTGGGQHTSGWIGFGPDRMLYIGFGDAVGGLGTVSHLLNYPGGKLLRVDPRTDQFPADTRRNFAIPAGNPFPVLANPPFNSPLPEIIALGLRNPWRCSFDRANGDLYIGDVGETRAEEINRIPLGATFPINFGWPCFEGNAVRPSSSANCTQVVGHTLPWVDLGRNPVSCVVGGYVYRGAAMPSLRGRYVFSSCRSSSLYSVFPNAVTGSLALHGSAGGGVYCFGEDHEGELYVGTDLGLRKLRAGTPPTSDCNRNLINDFTEVQQCLELDVNRNNIPDSCERRCAADFNVSGHVDVQDALAFVSAWYGTTICTDLNSDRRRGVQDLFEFLSAWFTLAGCE